MTEPRAWGWPVLISPEELASLEDTLELLCDALPLRVKVSDDRSGRYELRVAGPAVGPLDRLAERVAAAIVEFMLGPLLDNPHRVGGALRRELDGLHSARRGADRVVYRIDDPADSVIVVRIDHRSTIYRPR